MHSSASGSILTPSRLYFRRSSAARWNAILSNLFGRLSSYNRCWQTFSLRKTILTLILDFYQLNRGGYGWLDVDIHGCYFNSSHDEVFGFRVKWKKKKIYYQRLFYCHYSLTYNLSDKLILNVKFIIFLFFLNFNLNKRIATLRHDNVASEKFWLRVRKWKISSEPCGLFVLFPSFCTFFSLLYFILRLK